MKKLLAVVALQLQQTPNVNAPFPLIDEVAGPLSFVRCSTSHSDDKKQDQICNITVQNPAREKIPVRDQPIPG